MEIGKFVISVLLAMIILPVIFLAFMYFPANKIFFIVIVSFALTLSVFIGSQKTFLAIFAFLIVFNLKFQQLYLFSIKGANVYPIDIAIIALLFCFAFDFLKSRRLYFTPDKSSKIFLLFLIWNALAVLRGFYSFGYHAIGESRWYAFPVIFYFFVVAIFDNREKIASLMKWFMWLIILMLIVHFLDFYIIGHVLVSTGRRTFRFITSYESLIISFALLALIVSNMSRNVFLKGVVIKNVTLIALLAAVIFTQHRSVWVAMAAGLVYACLLLRRLSIKLVLAGIVVLLLMVFLAPFIENTLSVDIFESVRKSAAFITNPSSDPTGSWRVIGWKQEIEAAMKNPIFGQGLGGYSSWVANRKLLRVAVHNGYIMYFSKFGLIGCVLFFTGLFCWYRGMISYLRLEKNKLNKFLGQIILVCIFTHLIYSIFYSFSIFFWILLSMGTVLTQTNRHKDRCLAHDKGLGA